MPSVLVTGAGRGIGLAITRHMSALGWEVYAGARSEGALRELADLPRVNPIRLDISDRDSVAALPDALPSTLDGVVNNAGVVVNGPVEGLTLDDLSWQLEVNVVAQIAVTQAVLPKIRAAKGRIVFISSVSGLITTPGTGAYCASKYALESLADALRIELRPWGIAVSLVEPGPIRTDIWGDILVDHDRGIAFRFGCMLVAIGAILGRAVAGDWPGYASTLVDFMRVGWPALLFLVFDTILARFTLTREIDGGLWTDRATGVIYLVIAAAYLFVMGMPA